MEIKNIFFICAMSFSIFSVISFNFYNKYFQKYFSNINKTVFLKKLIYSKRDKKNVVKINRFIFHGLLNISKEEVFKLIEIREGYFYKELDIQNCLKDLLNSHKFENVEIKQIEDTLIFELKEFSILKNIQIIGNNTVDEDFIKSILKSVNIEINSQLRNDDINEFKKQLLSYYENISRPNASIKIFLTYEEHNFSKLKIIIEEGSAVRFKSVCVVGNEHFSNSELESMFELNKRYEHTDSPFSKQYRKKDLDRDINLIKDFYHNHGFLNFKVLGVYYDHAVDLEDFYVTVDIEEGECYKVSNIFLNEVDSNVLSEQDFIKNFEFNKIYDPKEITPIEKNIRVFLSQHGYLNPNISIEPELNNQTYTVDLRFKIDKGSIFVVNKIFFQGNNKISEKFLRNLIVQEEGKIFNFYNVSKALNNLKSTNYFKKVELILSPVPNSLNLVNVTFKVIE